MRLEPLAAGHLDALAIAAAEDRSTYRLTAVPDGREAMAAYIGELERERAQGAGLPFAQLDTSSGRAVGVTRYLNPRRRSRGASPYAIEIGGTWLAASAQRTGVNVEAKLLLLTHAFDTWGCGRVELVTDARNERSRRAIERLGAAYEGTLRNWQPSHVRGEEDRLRDTAVFSILDREWPRVRETLLRRLSDGAERPLPGATPGAAR